MFVIKSGCRRYVERLTRGSLRGSFADRDGGLFQSTRMLGEVHMNCQAPKEHRRKRLLRKRLEPTPGSRRSWGGALGQRELIGIAAQKERYRHFHCHNLITNAGGWQPEHFRRPLTKRIRLECCENFIEVLGKPARRHALLCGFAKLLCVSILDKAAGRLDMIVGEPRVR